MEWDEKGGTPTYFVVEGLLEDAAAILTLVFLEDCACNDP